MAKQITLLVGPPGSGKTTFANDRINNDGDHGAATVRVSQDDQGKRHMEVFYGALLNQQDIIVDRMNFDKEQRERYLEPARKAGYTTSIVVFHTPMKACLERCKTREGHPTIKDESSAIQANNLFFSKYERVQDDEANSIIRKGWVNSTAVKCIWSDLDGTLANAEHRRHYVANKPKNWKAFFDDMILDPVDEVCQSILSSMSGVYPIVYATGRPDNYRQHTEMWLQERHLIYPGSLLLMRMENDKRQDDIVKEIILEFEVKTKYNIFFALDDRDQVVKMLRKHNVKVLQVAEGNF